MNTTPEPRFDPAQVAAATADLNRALTAFRAAVGPAVTQALGAYTRIARAMEAAVGARPADFALAPPAAEDQDAYRLDQIRTAARLHRQQLISTSELYAAIEADDETPAAARRDDTTGAPAGCWCGHPEHRHYTGNTRMTFPDGCKDCRGWDGAHTYGQEPPWDRNTDTDDTTGA